jgi:DNA-binding transcriptional regulator YhcF (GntR family)
MWLTINEEDSRPIYLQIIAQVREQVRSGRLKPGDELPSVRELADSLGINMHTVRSAYLKLRDQGILNLRLGRRATIAKPRQPIKNEEAEAELRLRLEEWMTDALLMGLSSEQIQQMIEKPLKEMETQK